jgi:hypothetical protein
LADATRFSLADAGNMPPAAHPPIIAAAPFKIARRSDFPVIAWMRFMSPGDPV